MAQAARIETESSRAPDAPFVQAYADLSIPLGPAQHLRDRAETPYDVACTPLTGHVLAVGFRPAMYHAADHPHGDDRFGISVSRLREFAPRGGKTGRGLGRPSSEHLCEQGQRHEEEGAAKSGVSQPGVE